MFIPDHKAPEALLPCVNGDMQVHILDVYESQKTCLMKRYHHRMYGFHLELPPLNKAVQGLEIQGRMDPILLWNRKQICVEPPKNNLILGTGQSIIGRAITALPCTGRPEGEGGWMERISLKDKKVILFFN